MPLDFAVTNISADFTLCYMDKVRKVCFRYASECLCFILQAFILISLLYFFIFYAFSLHIYWTIMRPDLGLLGEAWWEACRCRACGAGAVPRPGRGLLGAFW